MHQIIKYILMNGILFLMTIIYGQITLWIDKLGKINTLTRKLMNKLSWSYEEIRASLVGLFYYFTPILFSAILCFYYKFNILDFLSIQIEYIPYILITIMGEFSMVSMFSGFLSLISSETNWAYEIGNISWITSIKKRRKWVAPLVPGIGAFFEEIFFRGVVFLLMYSIFPEFGFLPPLVMSTILFSIEQALFTQNRNQMISMILGSVSISIVACISVVFAGSLVPSILAHEFFLIFYFGKFKFI